MHDKKALDEEELKTDIPVNLGVDLGFEGLEIPNVRVVLPWKKPRGKELTELQKQQNTCFARRRIKVEHAIAGIKRNRSVADIYRNIKIISPSHPTYWKMLFRKKSINVG